MRGQLSAAQWDVLTERLGLEGYPPPIRVLSHGHTDVERARLRAEVTAELQQLGLLRAGRVDADLEATLMLLHRPSAWVRSVWLPHAAAEQPVRIVAARAGTAGVRALQHPERPGATVLEVIPATALAAAVVTALPPHPPGRAAVTLSLQIAPAPERGVLVTVPTARTDAERSRAAVAAILDQPHTRAGQIAAAARDPSGRVHRSEVLRWCDNPDGRYLMTVNRGPRGPESLAVLPGDSRRLGSEVQRLLASLPPR